MENKLTPAAVAALSDEELAKECAERVMGWEYIAQGCGWYARKGDGYAYQCAVFSPATSLADAAMCTEAMLAKGWFMELEGYKSFSTGKPYYVCRLWMDGDDPVPSSKEATVKVCAYAATEPRARAEAALLACAKEEG